MELSSNKINSQSSDIHDYLSSFNKEIQDVNSVKNSEKEKLDEEELKKEKTVQDEKCLDGVTYFTTADGSLYTTSGSDLKQQLAFLTTPEGVSGLQHILLAVGDVGNLSNVTASDLAIPVQLSTPISMNSSYQPTIEKSQQENKTDEIVTNESDLVSRDPAGEQNLQTPEPNQILVNTGDSYQAVTILPQSSSSGELSYVLLLAPPKENNEAAKEQAGNDQGNEQSNEQSNEDNDEKVLKSIEEGPGFKTLTLRLSQKPTQILAQQHICNYCEYTSSKRYLLSRHLKSHSDDRPHKCNVCDRGFKTLASLNNHVNTHTGTRPHSCKACDSSFTTSGELVRHIRYKHTHEKPHHCSECDYASVELSKLKRHMRCHTGERPYRCPHCTYASPDTYKLKRHMRIHTGEKPYMCNICSARFTQSNSLKAHQMIHSGSKPVFQCEFCPTTCGRKTDLRIHMKKLHPGEIGFQCKDCDMVFQDQDTFVQHCKTHQDDAVQPFWFNIQTLDLPSHMFPCDQCEETFDDKGTLRQHKSQYHNIGFKSSVEEDIKNNNDSITCLQCNKKFASKNNLVHHLEAFPTHKVNVCKDFDNDESTDIEVSNDMIGDGEKKSSSQVIVTKLKVANSTPNQEEQLIHDEEEEADDPPVFLNDNDPPSPMDSTEAPPQKRSSKGLGSSTEKKETNKGNTAQSTTTRCSPRTKKVIRKPVIRKTRSSRLVKILPKASETDIPIEEPTLKLPPKKILRGRKKH